MTMSKQSGDMPAEEERSRTQSKRGKQHGRFELWVCREGREWRWGRYKSRPVIEAAAKAMKRKLPWSSDIYRIEIREV